MMQVLQTNKIMHIPYYKRLCIAVSKNKIHDCKQNSPFQICWFFFLINMFEINFSNEIRSNEIILIPFVWEQLLILRAYWQWLAQSLKLIMMLLLTCAGGKILFSELWVFPCSAVLSALHWMGQLHRQSCGSWGIARKLSHVGPDQLWSTWTKSASAWQQCRRSWMFSQKWPALVLMLLMWQGQNPEKHQCVWIIPTSCFCRHLPGVRLTFHQNTEPEVTELRLIDCKHIKVKQILASSTEQMTGRVNIL